MVLMGWKFLLSKRFGKRVWFPLHVVWTVVGVFMFYDELGIGGSVLFSWLTYWVFIWLVATLRMWLGLED